MRQPTVVLITASSCPEGSLLGDLLAVINVFTADPVYDPVVNAVLVFAAVLFVEPAVEHFSTIG